MLTVLWLVVVLLGVLALAYINAAGILWSAMFAAAIAVAWVAHASPCLAFACARRPVRFARDPAQCSRSCGAS